MRPLAVSIAFPAPLFLSGPFLVATMPTFPPVSHRLHLSKRYGDIYKLEESAINATWSPGKCTTSDEFRDDHKRVE